MKTKPYLLALGILVSSILSSNLAVASTELQGKVVKVSNDTGRFSSPDLNSQFLGAISEHMPVLVLDEMNGFLKVVELGSGYGVTDRIGYIEKNDVSLRPIVICPECVK